MSLARSGAQRRLVRVAKLDAMVWAIGLTFDFFGGTPESLVALGGSVMVPLGVAAWIGTLPNQEASASFWELLPVRTVSLGAPFAMATFVVPRGSLAAALAAVWLAATLFVFIGSAIRILERVRGRAPLRDLAIEGAGLYLPVGAVWLVASRAAIPLLGFREPVVTYTANHFHYAGFAAPLIAGLLGRVVSTSRMHNIACGIVLAGIPLVAAGITFTHALELPAAVLLGIGMLLLSRELLVHGARLLRQRRISGLALFLSGASLIVSMSFAIVFASTGSATRGAAPPLIPFTTMVRFHGVVNAVGFAIVGLVGLLGLSPAEAQTSEPKPDDGTP